MNKHVTREIIEYSDDIQRLLLQCMISDEASFARCRQIIEPKYWTEKLRPAARYILKFADEYTKLPTSEQIYAETNVTIPAFVEAKDHASWFLDTIEEFCRHKAMEALIYDGPKLLDEGQYAEVERRSKENMMISLQKDLGTDYFSNPLERLQKMRDKTGMTSTGWKAIDDKLYGGMNRGELTFFAGGPGCVTADTLIRIIRPVDASSREFGEPELVPISSLSKVKLIDHVFAFSPDGWVPVSRCVKKEPKQILEVTMRNGMVVKASIDHLFQRKNQEWVYAADLLLGDLLITEDGISPVESVTKLEFEEVYDLAINHANHRYYTGGICSHNTGKSLFLQNLALNWVQMGLNVVYITLELSEELVGLRYDAMITETPTRQIFKEMEDIALRLGLYAKKGSNGIKPGKLQIRKLPEAGTKANDIRAFLKEYEIQSGIKPDALVVDYLDLLHPNSGKVGPSDLFVKDKYTSEELRALASEWNVLCATASQLNRASIQEQDFDPSHIAGGISKINTADNVLGIFTSAVMKERGEYQIQFLKTRSSSGVGSKVFLQFDPASLRITDAPEGTGSQNGNVSALTAQLAAKKPSSTPVASQTVAQQSSPTKSTPPTSGGAAGLRALMSRMNDS